MAAGGGCLWETSRSEMSGLPTTHAVPVLITDLVLLSEDVQWQYVMCKLHQPISTSCALVEITPSGGQVVDSIMLVFSR